MDIMNILSCGTAKLIVVAKRKIGSGEIVLFFLLYLTSFKV